MANEHLTDLPNASNATLTDIIYAVQGFSSPASPGISVQETMQQVFNLMLANVILNNAGNPNGAVAGVIYQLCWDKTNNVMYVCTTTGNAASAIWASITAGTAIVTPAKGGTGVANPTAHTLPVAEGSFNFNFLGPLGNGQLLIGSTGADPVPATLTVGPGLSIINGPGSITLSGTASGIGWIDVTGTSQSMVANNGYTANNAGLVTFTLPAVAAYGTGLAVVGKGAGGWTIAQRAGQNLQIGNTSSTVGLGGSVASSNQFDSINLVCTSANTTWTVLGGIQGNVTIV